MNIHAFFTFRGVSYTFTRSLSSFDRNYDDESYAYFLERIPNTEDGLFEINVVKDWDNGGELVEVGYTSIYSSSDHAMPDHIVSTEIKFDYSNI